MLAGRILGKVKLGQIRERSATRYSLFHPPSGKAVSEEYPEHTTSISFIDMVLCNNGFKENTTPKREALPRKILPVSFRPSIGRHILRGDGTREKLIIVSACARRRTSSYRSVNMWESARIVQHAVTRGGSTPQYPGTPPWTKRVLVPARTSWTARSAMPLV